MALKAYKEQTFKATIKFLEDDSTVGATFRMPRPIDYYSSADGNLNVERQRFLANIFKSFDKPIQVEVDGGSIINVDSLTALMELGVPMDLSDALIKWAEKHAEIQKQKDELVKKQKSAGNSTIKATHEAKK